MTREEIEEVREGEQYNYEESRRAVGDSIYLVQDLLDLYSLLARLVKESGISPRDEVVAACQFFLGCRYQLTMGSLIALRGHLNDSFYFTRKAIEFCAFAARVKKHPHLAMVWLNAQENYEEFRQKFSPGKLFPEDDVLLGKLYGRYDFCSKMIHANIFSFSRHMIAEGSATEFNLQFDYFQLSNTDPGEPIRTLLFILDTHLGILRVFENILDGVVAHDPSTWAAQRDLVDAKLASHKAKWRSIAEVKENQ